MDTNENKEVNIDILAILLNIWKNKILILLICCLSAVSVFAFFAFFKKPTFSTSSEIYVLTSTTGTSTSYNDLVISNQLVNDIEKIITNVTITEQVADKLGISLSPGTIASEISVNAKTDTRILVITVTDTDPFRAAQIANAIRDIAADKIISVMGLDAVNLISEARIPSTSSGTGAVRNAVLAFVLVFIVCAVVIALLEIFNDSIKTPEDVDRYLGIGVLGSIPYSKNINSKSSN